MGECPWVSEVEMAGTILNAMHLGISKCFPGYALFSARTLDATASVALG